MNNIEFPFWEPYLGLFFLPFLVQIYLFICFFGGEGLVWRFLREVT